MGLAPRPLRRDTRSCRDARSRGPEWPRILVRALAAARGSRTGRWSKSRQCRPFRNEIVSLGNIGLHPDEIAPHLPEISRSLVDTVAILHVLDPAKAEYRHPSTIRSPGAGRALAAGPLSAASRARLISCVRAEMSATTCWPRTHGTSGRGQRPRSGKQWQPRQNGHMLPNGRRRGEGRLLG